MKTYICIEKLKKHLNIESAYIDDDDYLMGLIDVATFSIANYLELEDLTSLELKSGMLHPSIMHAILLFSGHLYANREPITYGTPSIIPYTFAFLVQPFKRYNV